jgi:hypothetical protein
MKNLVVKRRKTASLLYHSNLQQSRFSRLIQGTKHLFSTYINSSNNPFSLLFIIHLHFFYNSSYKSVFFFHLSVCSCIFSFFTDSLASSGSIGKWVFLLLLIFNLFLCKNDFFIYLIRCVCL